MQPPKRTPRQVTMPFWQDQLDYLEPLNGQGKNSKRAQWIREAVDEKREREEATE